MHCTRRAYIVSLGTCEGPVIFPCRARVEDEAGMSKLYLIKNPCGHIISVQKAILFKPNQLHATLLWAVTRLLLMLCQYTDRLALLEPANSTKSLQTVWRKGFTQPGFAVHKGKYGWTRLLFWTVLDR